MQITLYVIVYLIPAAISAGLSLYAWRRRAYAGAWPFALLMAAVVFWSISHALSVGSTTFAGTLFWAQVQYGGVVLAGPLWILFALAYSGQGARATPLLRVALFVPAALAYAAVLTNSQHQLWWTSVAPAIGRPFASLEVKRGILFWLHAAYSYGCVMGGLALFIQTMLEAAPINQHQSRLVVLGALAPIGGNLAHLLGLQIQAVDDPTPLLFSFSGVILAYATLRYHLLDLTPIAQREILASMPDGIVVLDRRGAIALLNGQARRLLEIRQDVWSGRLLLDLMAGSILEADLRALLANPAFPAIRQTIYDVNNDARGLEIRLRPLFDDNGAGAGALLVLRDTTERVRMERQIDRHMTELVLLNQIARSANAAAQTNGLLRGIGEEIVRALPWERVVFGLLRPGSSTFHLMIDLSRNGAPVVEGQYIAVADLGLAPEMLETGETRVLYASDPQVAGTPVGGLLEQIDLQTALIVPMCGQTEPLGAMWVGSSRVQPVAAEELRLFETIGKLLSEAIVRAQLYEEAQQASQLKSSFLATVSHELRTPLTSIIGYSDMLQRGVFGPLPNTTNEPLAQIRHNSATLLRLINDILDFSKMEAGYFSVDLYPVDLMAVVQAAIGAAQPQVNERGLSLQLDLPSELPLVYANSTRLEQVLANLLSNAVKFTEQGKVTVRAEYRDERVRLSVEDMGIGIAPEHQQLLFQAFRQIESPQTRRFGGTGLGLAISKRLMELMDGSLTCESTPGIGSIFSCELRTVAVSPQRSIAVAE